MNQLRKQSTFFQRMAAQAKLNAYYTEQEHCCSIAEILEFPKGEEVCVLEPAIGDAEAVRTVTGQKKNKNIHIFGVELNSETAESVLNTDGVEECIWGDFLTDVLIGVGNFSFCFSNPPYGEIDGVRLELRFIKKIIPCLAVDGVMVYVIPEYVAKDDRFLEEWCEAFHTEKLFRFRKSEYKKWKQVVIIGRRTKKSNATEKNLLRETFSLDGALQELPMHYTGKKVKVYSSKTKDITEFTAKNFNEERIRKSLRESPMEKMIMERIIPKPFISDQLNRPPIMPNHGQLYLMAVAGAGQGMAGTSENRDLHLQRGIVKKTEENNTYNENGRMYLSVQHYTSINFNIIQNDGTRHQL